MWVLAVVQGLTLPGLSGLKEQRVATAADRGGLEGGHEREPPLSRAMLARGHQHHHVLGNRLVTAARPAHALVGQKGFAVGHQAPAMDLAHPAVYRRAVRHPRRSRTTPAHGSPQRVGHGHPHVHGAHAAVPGPAVRSPGCAGGVWHGHAGHMLVLRPGRRGREDQGDDHQAEHVLPHGGVLP